jgi:hypothetical protein
MNIYLIEYKNNIIGTYNNYYLAEMFILSCLQNNFIEDSALIHHYKKNSCFKYDTNTISLDCNSIIKSNTQDILSELYEISSSDDTTSCMDYISSSSSSDDTEDIDIDKKLLHNSNSELNQNSVVLQLNERNPVLQKSNPVLQKSNPVLQKSNPVLQKSSVELQKSSAVLQKSNPVLQKSNPVLQKSNPVLQKSSAELQEHNTELQKQSAELQEHNPLLQKRSAELQEHNPLLQKRSAELHEHNAVLHKRSAELHEHSAVLQRNINKLKLQKEKINESKQVYESDLKLFNIFKNSVETNENFEIPVIFAKKYEIMNKLFIEDKLTWENFINNYKNENYYGDYFSSNSYEEKFANNSENDLCTTTIDEQIDITIK